MVDLAVQRKFSGNASLYRSLAVREPRLFLRRNLNTVLDAHEHLLSQPTNAEPYEAMKANERRATGWRYPTDEMLGDLVRGQKPILKIDHLRLRLSQSHGGSNALVTRQSGGDASSGWLPDPSDGMRIPCSVVVIVLDTSKTGTTKRITIRDTRQGVIIQRQDARGKQYFDIALAQPFTIEISKFFVPTESGTNGYRHWKRTVTASYSLDVAVQCQNSIGSAKLLSQLESRSALDFKDKPANEGEIKASWTDLPECPSEHQVIPIKRASGHKSLDLDYGMEISMGWARRKDSLLEQYNQIRDTQVQQLPTPSASDDQEAAVVKSTEYVVRYTVQQGLHNRAYTVDGLKCMFCESGGQNGVSDMYNSRSALTASVPRVERLLLHYMTFHSFFEWELTGRTTTSSGKVMVAITFTPKEKQARPGAAQEDDATEEYSWVAPDRPFNLSAHVAGDQTWTGGSRTDTVGKRGRKPRTRVIGDAMEVVPTLAERPKSLAEVQDLPRPSRKKYSVPVVQNVTFYHSSSKLPIQPGEELSESEDDLHDDRLLHSQRRNFGEHGLGDAARDFHEAFHRHLDGEQSASKRFTRDAIVRFARKQQGQLRSSEWLSEYESKLKHLQSHGVIGADVVAHCLEEAKPLQDSQRDKEVRGEPHETERDETMEDQPATPKQTPHRERGKFAKPRRSDGNDQELPINETPKRKKKPHKWSGGGADRDIIKQGLTNGIGSEPPVRPRSMSKPSEESLCAGTTTPNGHTRRQRPRIRYEGGKFNQYDEQGNLLPRTPHGEDMPCEASKSATGSGAKCNFIEIGDDMEIDREVPMIGHCNLECKRPGTRQRVGPVICYTLLKDSISAKAMQSDTAVAEDLDFKKFMSLVKTQLDFDSNGEEIMLLGSLDELCISDERAWHAALNAHCRKSLPGVVTFIVRLKEAAPKDQLGARIAGSSAGNNTQAKLELRKSTTNATIPIQACSCGQVAENLRGSIACDNPTCRRGNFHLACVGLDRRAVGWKCEDCVGHVN